MNSLTASLQRLLGGAHWRRDQGRSPAWRPARPTTLARQLLILQGLVVAVIVLTATAVASVNAERSAQQDAEVQARAIVAAAAAHGVVGYLLEPFTYAALRDRLMACATFRDQVSARSATDQEDVDRALEGPRHPRQAHLPKGMHRQTLDSVVAVLRAGGGLSAAQTAEGTGTSRITARRYLEYLAEAGLATRPPLRRCRPAGDGVPLAVSREGPGRTWTGPSWPAPRAGRTGSWGSSPGRVPEG